MHVGNTIGEKNVKDKRRLEFCDEIRRVLRHMGSKKRAEKCTIQNGWK